MTPCYENRLKIALPDRMLRLFQAMIDSAQRIILVNIFMNYEEDPSFCVKSYDYFWICR